MPELTPSGAVDVVQRQVRRVRRRKNLYELQRALYLTLAAGAAAATLLLPLALLAPAGVFALAAWGTLAVGAGIVLLLTAAARRRWLGRHTAVAWVDAHGGLAGRLRTLLELTARPGAAPGFFHSLLVAQVAGDLDRWTPRRLVPRRVPRLAFATAVATTAMLAVALRLAALAVPAAPTLTFSDQPLAGAEPTGPADAAAGERVVVAPGVPQPGGNHPAAAEGDDDSTLTRLPSALQENVRQQVWGKAWERVRDALARAGTSGGSSASRDTTTEYGEEVRGDESEEWEVARAPSGELTRRRRPGIGRQPAARTDGTDASDPATESRAGADQGEREGGEGGGGAGNGISPDLFGGPSVDTADTAESFELPLAARMRAERATDRRVGGTAPSADPDARPALAAEQRRESAAHRMAIPAAYETVVREVFAHRRPETEQP